MRILLFALPGVAAALLAWLLTPLARRVSFQVGAVDRPTARKVHAVPTPRLGGAAVVASAATVLLVVERTGNLASQQWVSAMALGSVPILLVSITDDVKRLSALVKFMGHLSGSAIAVALGVSLADHVHIFGADIAIGWFAYPLSILWLIGVTNGFNLIDGLDGLSAGLALISAGSLIPVFVAAHQTGAAIAASILAGAILGFLPFNLHPAKIFLGDTGATAIGFCLACLTLRGGSTISAGFATLLPVIVLGIPVADTLLSMARRLVRVAGRAPRQMFEADRAHVHHRLLDLGLDHRTAVLTLYGVGLCLAAAGLVSVFMTRQEAGLLLVGLLLAGFVGVGRLGYQEFGIIRSGVVLRFYDAPVLRRSLFVVFLDLVFVAVSVYAAIGLKFDDWGLLGTRTLAVHMVSVLVPSTVVVLWLLGLYKGSWRQASVYDVVRICAAVSTAALVGFLSIRLAFGETAPLSLFFVYALVKTAVANASRMSYRVLAATGLRASAAGRRALIYGAGEGGAAALREMLANPDVGLRPVGFIDDGPARTGKMVNGVQVVGTLKELEDAIRSLRAETLVVSTEKVPEEKIAVARAACERAGVAFVRMQIRFDELTVGTDAVSRRRQSVGTDAASRTHPSVGTHAASRSVPPAAPSASESVS